MATMSWRSESGWNHSVALTWTGADEVTVAPVAGFPLPSGAEVARALRAREVVLLRAILGRRRYRVVR